jgi:hypothetical protein
MARIHCKMEYYDWHLRSMFDGIIQCNEEVV